MEPLLLALLSPPVISAVGAVFALTLLGLLLALAIYTGLYYSVPRVLVKWLSRQAIPIA